MLTLYIHWELLLFLILLRGYCYEKTIITFNKFIYCNGLLD